MNNSDIKLDDIIGFPREKEEIKKMIYTINNYSELKKDGISFPKGLCIEGYGRCGKTALACALMNECNVNKIIFELDDRDVALNIRESFDKAKALKPSILFIDNINLILFNRIGINQKVLEAFYSQMNSLDSSDEIFVLITSGEYLEYPSLKLQRLGRIEKTFHLDQTLNVENGEYKLLWDSILSKYREFDQIDRNLISNYNIEFDYAYISNIVNETLIYLKNSNKEKASIRDIELSIKGLKRNIRRKATKEEEKVLKIANIARFIVRYKLTNHIEGIFLKGEEKYFFRPLIYRPLSDKNIVKQIAFVLCPIVLEKIVLNDELFHEDLYRFSTDYIRNNLDKLIILKNDIKKDNYISKSNPLLSDDKLMNYESLVTNIITKAYNLADKIIKENLYMYYDLVDMFKDGFISIEDINNYLNKDIKNY